MSHKTSGSYPFFEKIARELVDKLSDDPSQDAKEIVFEARRLLDQLQTFAEEEPPHAKKTEVIQQLLDINRQALDYLTKK